MRLVDADKLHPDCLTSKGTLAISQSQLANAPSVDVTALCPVDFPTADDPYPCCSYKRPKGECCGSCYLCDVGNCGADMRKGGAPESLGDE